MIATLIMPLLATQFRPFPLIPKPTTSTLKWTKPVICEIPNNFADGIFKSGKADAKNFSPPIRFYKDDNEGFKISITRQQIGILSKPGINQSMAVEYLSRLTKINNGAKVLPTGTVELRPKVAWRGVHLFVGPKALAFHKKLWTRVLLPLGFNKVVLQCEQTEWKCLPNLKGGISMKREDLRKLCDWYRSVGVEVIPLIQSFGHVKWLNNNGANRDLFLNPTVPFAVDPRKARVKQLYSKLWKEVIEVTKPKTIHVGLDEVDFRGFPTDPELLTKLWKIQVPFLATLAKQNKVTMMLWGDELLAPGEGAAPHRAKTKENAKARRSVIPKGSYICDWHYQKNADPKLYEASLELFQNEGFRPIASSWFEPENVRGFNLAAISAGAGTLQTTWAGYESNEIVMTKNLSQFSAMILASDYAWSGRTELPSKIGYDPAKVFNRLYKGKY
jgi:hexosaminidase